MLNGAHGVTLVAVEDLSPFPTISHGEDEAD